MSEELVDFVEICRCVCLRPSTRAKIGKGSGLHVTCPAMLALRIFFSDHHVSLLPAAPVESMNRQVDKLIDHSFGQSHPGII